MKMAITAVKPSARLLAFLMVTVLTGCGLTQTVKDGAVSVTQSIFYPQVKTLHLDLRAREGVNNNAKGASLATVVRIYQLKDRQAFDNTDYPSLFAGDGQALQAERVAEKDVRLRPGESRGDNPAAMRTWYVPEGVDTGPSGHRNADGRGPKKPYGNKPRGAGPGRGNPNAGGGYRQNDRQNEGRGAGPRGEGQSRPKHPYGHPGNAPSFPSDHANPGSHNPYGQAPRQNRGPRPGGNRPAGNRGPRPGGGGNRGPRGGGQGGR